MMHVISLGAGVQSTTMALLAAHGEITPMPDCAIFADTGNEPAAVYEHLRWLTSGNVLPFPVHIVTDRDKSLGDEILASTRGQSLRGSHARPPFYVKNPDGTRGMLNRQCTGDFKIRPITRKLREVLGLRRRQRWPKSPVVSQWIGISLDEATRMKPSQVAAVVTRWPLIERRMSRSDCLLWLERHNFPRPPKSACTFCPYRSDVQWRHLRDTDPHGWCEAVGLDRAIRRGLKGPGLQGQLYLHASLTPLDQVDLSTAAERGQPDLFNNECEGMCGV